MAHNVNPLIPPIVVRIHPYPQAYLPLPNYRPVPDKTWVDILLEHAAVGTELVGKALIGVGSSGSADDSSDDEEQVTKVTAGINPQVAAAGAVSLGVSGLFRFVSAIAGLPRQNAIEANAREEKQALVKAEILLAQFEAQYKATRGANEDELKRIQEAHQFVLKQLEIRRDLEVAKAKIKGETEIAGLEQQFQTNKLALKTLSDCMVLQLEAQATAQKTKYEHEEKSLKLCAQLVENSQQIAIQAIKSHEAVALRALQSTEQARVEQRTILSLHPDIANLVGQLKTPQFKSKREINRCLDGLTIYRLLVEKACFGKDVLNGITFQINQGYLAHSDHLRDNNKQLSQKSLLTSILSMNKTLETEVFEFFNFIVDSLQKTPKDKKEIILREILSSYANNFKHLTV